MSGNVVGKPVSTMDTFSTMDKYNQYVEQLEKLTTEAEGSNDPLADGITAQLEQIDRGWGECARHPTIEKQELTTLNRDIHDRMITIWQSFIKNPQLFDHRFQESMKTLTDLEKQSQHRPGKTMVSNFTILNKTKEIEDNWHSLEKLNRYIGWALTDKTKQISSTIFRLRFHGANEVILGSPRSSYVRYNVEIGCKLFLQHALPEGHTPKDLDTLLSDSETRPTLDLVAFDKDSSAYSYSAKSTVKATISSILGTLRHVRDQNNLSCIGAVLEHHTFFQGIILLKNVTGGLDLVILFNPGTPSSLREDPPFCVAYPSMEEAENFLASFHNSIEGDYFMKLYISKSQQAILEMSRGATQVVQGPPRSKSKYGDSYSPVLCRAFLEDAGKGVFPKNDKDLNAVIERGLKLLEDTQVSTIQLLAPLSPLEGSGRYRWPMGQLLDKLLHLKKENGLQSIGAVLVSSDTFKKTHAVFIRDEGMDDRMSISIFYPGVVDQTKGEDNPFYATFSSMKDAIAYLEKRSVSVSDSYDIQSYCTGTEKPQRQIPKTALPPPISASRSASTVSNTTASSLSQEEVTEDSTEDSFTEAVDKLLALRNSMKDNLPQAVRSLANLQTAIPITIGDEEHTPSAGALVLYHLKQLHTNRNPRNPRLQDPEYGIKAFQNTLGFETDSRDLEIAFIRAMIDIHLAGYMYANSRNFGPLRSAHAYSLKYLDEDIMDQSNQDQMIPEMLDLYNAEGPEGHQKAEAIRAKLKEKWELI